MDPASHFVLYVADQRRSTAFYAAALGSAPRLEVPGMTEFDLPGGGVLGLMPEAGIRRLLGVALPDPAAGRGAPRAELYLVCGEPGAAHARALAAGARELSALAPRDWGHEAAYALDPDGHVLAFARPVPPPAGPAPGPKALVAAWVAAFNRGDAEALAAMYHEDAVNHQVAEAPVAGREAIRAMFAREFAAAEMECLVESLFEDGEWAILEWRDPLGLRGCGFFRVTAGRIAFQRGYWDKLSFLRQHGLPIPRA